MARKTSIAPRRRPPSLTVDLAHFLNSFAKGVFDPYRPELHYMRGPGPKWHAKHDPAPARFDGVPALARIRIKSR